MCMVYIECVRPHHVGWDHALAEHTPADATVALRYIASAMCTSLSACGIGTLTTRCNAYSEYVYKPTLHLYYATSLPVVMC